MRTLNTVAQSCNAEVLRVNPKAPDPATLRKLFGFLARRELEQPLAEQCRLAVVRFTENGGKLPDGIELREGGGDGSVEGFRPTNVQTVVK